MNHRLLSVILPVFLLLISSAIAYSPEDDGATVAALVQQKLKFKPNIDKIKTIREPISVLLPVGRLMYYTNLFFKPSNLGISEEDLNTLMLEAMQDLSSSDFADLENQGCIAVGEFLLSANIWGFNKSRTNVDPVPYLELALNNKNVCNRNINGGESFLNGIARDYANAAYDIKIENIENLVDSITDKILSHFQNDFEVTGHLVNMVTQPRMSGDPDVSSYFKFDLQTRLRILRKIIDSKSADPRIIQVAQWHYNKYFVAVSWEALASNSDDLGHLETQLDFLLEDPQNIAPSLEAVFAWAEKNSIRQEIKERLLIKILNASKRVDTNNLWVPHLYWPLEVSNAFLQELRILFNSKAHKFFPETQNEIIDAFIRLSSAGTHRNERIRFLTTYNLMDKEAPNFSQYQYFYEQLVITSPKAIPDDRFNPNAPDFDSTINMIVNRMSYCLENTPDKNEKACRYVNDPKRILNLVLENENIGEYPKKQAKEALEK